MLQRHHWPALLILIILALPSLAPATDIAETAYDESEPAPYEVTPSCELELPQFRVADSSSIVGASSVCSPVGTAGGLEITGICALSPFTSERDGFAPLRDQLRC